MSVYTTVFAGSTPVGALLMGWIASQFGVAESMILGGLVCSVIGVTAFAWIRRNRAQELITARAKPGVIGAAAQPSAARPR
jgi:MFS family permease